MLAFVIYQESRFTRLEKLASGPKGAPEARSYAPPELEVEGRVPPVRWRKDYVPVFSRIYHAGGKALSLDVTLVVRNPDERELIYVQRVDYVGTKGTVLRSFAERPFELRPGALVEFLVVSPREAAEEEVGGHFRVVWASRRPGTRPLIEAVMVDAQGQIAFSRSSVSVRPPAAEPAEPVLPADQRLAREAIAGPRENAARTERRREESDVMRPKNP